MTQEEILLIIETRIDTLRNRKGGVGPLTRDKIGELVRLISKIDPSYIFDPDISRSPKE